MNRNFRYIFLITMVVFCIGCRVTENPNPISSDVIQNPHSAEGFDDSELPIITFDNEIFDFGKISQGEKVSHKFDFENTGASDLIINSVLPACGCTLVDKWPQGAISPGDKSSIEVEFNSEGKIGLQEKTITVVTNSYPSTQIIYIKGEVAGPS